MSTEKKIENGRTAYLDYLRVIATVAVVLLHVSAQNWINADVNSLEWAVMNAYNGLVRWCVPAFVMISGALFLPRQIDTKTIYKKYILRLVIIYFTWSAFYAVIYPLIYNMLGRPYSISWQEIAKSIITGSYHLWYLPMVIGLYMCIPLIQPLVKKPETAKYFLLLAFVFACVFPQMINLVKDFAGEEVQPFADAVNVLVSNMYMNLMLGFTGFFVAGYVLRQTELKPKTRTWIYVLGIFGYVVTVVLNLLVSRQANVPQETYLYCFSVNIAVMIVAIFLWCKYNLRGSGKAYPWIRKLSQYSFGVYLIHPFVLWGLEKMGIHTLRFNPILSIPVICVMITTVSFGISFVLNKLPLIRKWLV